MKKLNIGMIGYGFMGRTHSNAFSQVNHFFDVPYQPVLRTVCARNAERAQAFAAKWGYESVETAGVRNMVWYNYRRVPAVMLAKQLIDEGRLGRIFHYRAKFLQDWTISTDLPV